MTPQSPTAGEVEQDLAAISEGRWTITELAQTPMLVLSNDDHIIAIIPIRDQPRARRDAEFLMRAPTRVQALAAENAELRDSLSQAQQMLERFHHDVAHAAGVLDDEEEPGLASIGHILDVIAHQKLQSVANGAPGVR